jgi:hypothetical protein
VEGCQAHLDIGLGGFTGFHFNAIDLGVGKTIQHSDNTVLARFKIGEKITTVHVGKGHIAHRIQAKNDADQGFTGVTVDHFAENAAAGHSGCETGTAQRQYQKQTEKPKSLKTHDQNTPGDASKMGHY